MEEKNDDNAGYGPDVHALLDNLEFPNDVYYNLDSSPGYQPSANPSSSNTPNPATPNEPKTDKSDLSKESSAIRMHPASAQSHIEDSDLSSISNLGTSSKIAFIAAEGSTVNLRNSENIKIIQDQYDVEESAHGSSDMKKSGEAGIFPKIHAETVVIPDGCETIPFDNPTNEEEKGLRREAQLELTPESDLRQWSHTPKQGVASGARGFETGSATLLSARSCLAHEGRKQVVSTKVCEESKLNLEEAIQKHADNAEYALSDEFHKMKVDLVQTQIKVKRLEEGNMELRAELDARTNELSELMCAFNEERNRNADLQEHIALVQQQVKDPSKLQGLRGQALENAKLELAQLRAHVQARDRKIVELETALGTREAEQRLEGSSVLKQMHELCAEVQRYKLLLAASARQTQEMRDTFASNYRVNKDNEEELHKRNKEIAKEINELRGERRRLEGVINDDKVMIEELKTNIAVAQTQYNELKQKYEKAFIELNEAREEIEQFGNIEKKDNSAIGYSEQIAQMKDQFNKKLQGISEELAKYKEEAKKKDIQIAEYERKLQEDPLMDLVGEPNEGILEEIEKMQRQEMEDALDESQRTIDKLKEDIQAQQIAANKLKELEIQYERLNESKTAMQVQLNNMNETLKIKDKEIDVLTQSRDVAESNEQAARKEVEELELVQQRCVKFISGAIEIFRLPFINLEYTIVPSMIDEEKLSEFNEYLIKVKEAIEADHAANLEVIESLKQQSEVQLPLSKESVEGDRVKKILQAKNEALLNDIEKLQSMLNEEREHNKKLLEDVEERHRMELETTNSSKDITINQLQDKVTRLLEKAARKKEKLLNQIAYNEELLNKQKELRDEARSNIENAVTDHKCLVQRMEEESEAQKIKYETAIEELNNDIKSKNALIKNLESSLEELKINIANLLSQAVVGGNEDSTRIEELEREVDERKSQIRNLTSENNSLVAECKRLKGLCDEARADMKKMVNASMKLNNSRDLNDSTSSNKQPTNNKGNSKWDAQTEQLIIQYEDRVAKLQEYIDSVYPGKVLDVLDSLIESSSEHANNPLAQKFTERIERITRIVEQKCMKELNDTIKENSKRNKDNALQLSIELRQSLANPNTETLTRLYEQALNNPERSSMRASTLEQQYKSELDIINNDNPYIQNSLEVPNNFNKSIKETVEEYGREVEETMRRVKEECRREVERMSVSKENWESREKEYREMVEVMRRKSLEQVTVLESVKEKEIQEAVKFKEEEIKSKLTIENLKLLNEKKEELKKQYTEARERLVNEFEMLKEKLHKEIEVKANKIEKEYQQLVQESTAKNEEVERKYKERIEEKEQLMDNIMKMRMKETEEDHRLQLEKLEYSLKYEAQCQAEKQRAEFAQERREVEERYVRKVEELEAKLRAQVSEGRRREEQLKDELKRLKEEEEVKNSLAKKKIEKEFNAKVEQLLKKVKEAEEKNSKLRKEYEEESKKLLEDKETALEALAKRHKDEVRIQKDKHRAEIRSVKESHKNELIKKGIEKDRELKKFSEQHAEALEKLAKEIEERKNVTKTNGSFTR